MVWDRSPSVWDQGTGPGSADLPSVWDQAITLGSGSPALPSVRDHAMDHPLPSVWDRDHRDLPSVRDHAFVAHITLGSGSPGSALPSVRDRHCYPRSGITRDRHYPRFGIGSSPRPTSATGACCHPGMSPARATRATHRRSHPRQIAHPSCASRLLTSGLLLSPLLFS